MFIYSGILVPGGFGVRGTEGKVLAVNWARKKNVPFLGKYNLCFNKTSCLVKIFEKRLMNPKTFIVVAFRGVKAKKV